MIAALLLLTSGAIPPTEMLDIFTQRLSRLDKLVLEVQVEQYFAPFSDEYTDPASWDGPYEPADGGRRILRIVRPYAVDESFAGGAPVPIRTSFSPQRVVQKLSATTQDGRSYFCVHDNDVTPSTYSAVPLLQMFDLQIHESFVRGLNILNLLRDHPTVVVDCVGDVTRYRSEVGIAGWGEWTEIYEYELNSRGTPLRFEMTKEALDGSGFVFRREFVTQATMEVNGAELVSEAFVFTSNTNDNVTRYAVHRMTVTSAAVDTSLTSQDVLFEPETRNSLVWTKNADLSEGIVTYDENGTILARESDSRTAQPWRKTLLPVASAVGVLTIVALAATRRAVR